MLVAKLMSRVVGRCSIRWSGVLKLEVLPIKRVGQLIGRQRGWCMPEGHKLDLDRVEEGTSLAGKRRHAPAAMGEPHPASCLI